MSFVIFIFVWQYAAANNRSLTLLQIEKVALSQSPEVEQLQAQASALSEAGIASGQLPDPKLTLGTMNVPTDTFSLTQEPMTQIQLGLQQSIPRGRSLHYRSSVQKELSRATTDKQGVMRLEVLKNVRLIWINLYYWLQTKQILMKEKVTFQHLQKVTTSMLANNQAQQKDLIRANLELLNIKNSLLEIDQQIEIIRAELSRWIGHSLANTATPKKLPNWPALPNLINLQHKLIQHPLLKTDTAVISAGRAGVQLAKQQYKPGLSVGVAYGFRQSNNTNGQKRANFLTAQLSMDLPFFTHNRQDRQLKASREKLVASESGRMSHYNQLNQTLKAQYDTFFQQKKIFKVYQTDLIKEAKQYATSTKIAYQNVQTDFPTLARAYIRQLNVELAALKTDVNMHAAHANLLYLEGK